MKTNTSSIDKLYLYGSLLFAITPAIALVIIITSAIL